MPSLSNPNRSPLKANSFQQTFQSTFLCKFLHFTYHHLTYLVYVPIYFVCVFLSWNMWDAYQKLFNKHEKQCWNIIPNILIIFCLCLYIRLIYIFPLLSYLYWIFKKSYVAFVKWIGEAFHLFSKAWNNLTLKSPLSLRLYKIHIT